MMLTGQNGILIRAQEAKEEWEVAEEDAEIKFSQMEELINEYAPVKVIENIAITDFTPYLNPDRNIEVTVADKNGPPFIFGEEILLHANITGYDNLIYTIQWQVSKEDDNDDSYVDYYGEGYNTPDIVIIGTEENLYWWWRVEVTITGVKDPSIRYD